MSCFRDGNPAAPLCIVGMAPGREELDKDQPFVGGSGRMLWSLLKRAGIDRADCYILNTIGEWPAGKTGGPTPEQFDQYWEQFDENMLAFEGRVVCLLGGDAMWRVCGLSSVEKWRGYLVAPHELKAKDRIKLVETAYKTKTKLHNKGDVRYVKERTSCPPVVPKQAQLFLPTLHPAGVMRSGFATLPALAADLRRVGRALRSELRPYRVRYFNYPIYRANEPAVSVDIETGGTDNAITRVGLADSMDCWTLPWGEGPRNALRPRLADEQCVKVFHNGGFDIPRLEAAGLPVVGPIFDTMYACAMLQPDLYKGLNAAASLYLDVPRWKHEAEDRPDFYNAMDNIRQYELMEVTKAELERCGQLELFTGTIMPGLRTLINMQQCGVALDSGRQRTWVSELATELQTTSAQWAQQFGAVNPRSPAQIKKLFQSLGMELRMNKYGGESADKEALARLEIDYPQHAPTIALLRQIKRLGKDLETYAKVHATVDGRVHASFVPGNKDDEGLGKGLAGTWRITAKEPNLQNQPARARRMYVPSAGMVFVGADYSQLEARILAAASGDGSLLAACNAGIHDQNAKLLGVDKVRAKNGFYGWGYLAGPRTLRATYIANGFDVSYNQCVEMLNRFDKEYHIAAGFRQKIIAEGIANRFVENPFGLRRYFYQREFPAPAAVSTWVQSSAAIMMWKVLPVLEAAMLELGGRLLITVHDDVLCEVPADARVIGMEALAEIMQREFDEIAPGFRCPVTKKWSDKSWGEMEEVP